MIISAIRLLFSNMAIVSILITACLVATGLAAVPDTYRKVLITSDADKTLVVVPTTGSNGSTIVVQTKTSQPSQVWYLQDGNSSIIYGAETTLCLDAGAQSNWKDMSRVYLQTCSDGAAEQQWNVMADGRIALAASSPQECLDLQYLRTVNNNPVGLYSCGGLGGIGAADTGINWPLVNVTS